jgi:predicted AlkP superfamily pyrophosphatase or phosphodiesterase
MKRLIFALLLLSGMITAEAQRAKELEQPKLVVGLMVDQMRWDYLTRYADIYCDGGFNRLMREGYNCNRCLINYIPAITAVGHTSVYTGSVPAMTGIVGNTFELNGRNTYCTTDTTVSGLGTYDRDGKPNPNVSAGKNSPHNLLVTTVTDQLRLATNFRSKVIGVALKDRASILPAGHSANAAYWMDNHSMNFITSTYYMDRLPQWVTDFNNRKLGDKYMENLASRNKSITDGPWQLLYDESRYVQSAPKNQKWENTIDGSLKQSPWGQTITFDMAKAAIEGEQLGTNPAGVPDFLCVSISSTDMLGHRVSPNSIWEEDTFLRLDKDIADFLDYLDRRVGKGNYLIFLTADHAGMHNPAFKNEHHLPAGTFETNVIRPDLESHLKSQFPAFNRIITGINNMQVHFSKEVKSSSQYEDIRRAAIDWLKARQEVAYAYALDNIPDYVPEPIRTMTINGYNPSRSGQITIVFQSGFLEDYASKSETEKPGYVYKGTTHSVWSPDDTHIPLIFMGWNVPHAWDNKTCYIVDIAATIAALLNIQQPNACVGHPIF